MNKLLVVEDEVITSDLLKRYFEIVGYEVINALTGTEALQKALEHMPKVIILDIMLPDMDGFEVCRKLRSNDRTNHIPIIFLTQKDDRRDRLDGLELGADDYITKPFDVEELRLRVHNILDRTGGIPLVDARTSLPNMELIKERLPELISKPDSVFIDVKIAQYDQFGAQYGPVAANQVIRSTAKLIADLLHEIDPNRSFVGHPRDDHFLIAIPRDIMNRIETELPERFAKQIVRFYDYPDQQRGKMKMDEELVPFMSAQLMRVKAEALKVLIQGAKVVNKAKGKPNQTPAGAEITTGTKAQESKSEALPSPVLTDTPTRPEKSPDDSQAISSQPDNAASSPGTEPPSA
nr:response regulator [Anaerolineae bacterium]